VKRGGWWLDEHVHASKPLTRCAAVPCTHYDLWVDEHARTQAGVFAVAVGADDHDSAGPLALERGAAVHDAEIGSSVEVQKARRSRVDDVAADVLGQARRGSRVPQEQSGAGDGEKHHFVGGAGESGRGLAGCWPLASSAPLAFGCSSMQ
jgi:hypothetical protein